MKRPLSNTDDVIDSRDVVERIEELELERSDLVEAVNDANEKKIRLAGLSEAKLAHAEAVEDYDSAKGSLKIWDEDYAAELQILKSLAEEGSNASPDWGHGEALIRESYWVDYVQELCEDIGDIPKNLPHYIVIDWEKTAENIAYDYSQVNFWGVTYYIRSC